MPLLVEFPISENLVPVSDPSAHCGDTGLRNGHEKRAILVGEHLVKFVADFLGVSWSKRVQEVLFSLLN